MAPRLSVKAKSAARFAGETARAVALRTGYRATSWFYRLIGPQFSHEFRTVAAGVSSYEKNRLGPRDLYHLRRNVHMLEKGLVMRPRRATFAVGYIQETIDLTRIIMTADALSTDELTWADHVLQEYFDATAASQSKIIAQARSDFAALSAAIDQRTHVPAVWSQPAALPGIEELTALAHARRSVRWYEDRVVPPSVVDAAMEVALQAPTACNRQPFRYVFIDDPSKRAEVAGIPMGTAGFAHQFPGLAVVVGDQSAFADERDRHLIYIDSCLASMSFIFGLEVQGVASCVINWPDIPAREAAMRQALALLPHEQVVMLISFGYEDKSALAPFSAKKPLSAARSAM